MRIVMDTDEMSTSSEQSVAPTHVDIPPDEVPMVKASSNKTQAQD